MTRFLHVVGVGDSQTGHFDILFFTDLLQTESGPDGLITYAYSANGETTSKTSSAGAVTYTWDFEGKMVGAVSPGELLAFAYDVDGIRTAKSVNGTLTKFVVDKNRDYAQVLEERDAANNLNVAYIYGDDLISQERAGGALSFYHYDGQLSTRQLTDVSAQVTDSYTYDAFGVTLASSGSTANNYLYTGEQHDPNVGFYYLRARYLNESVGRLTSEDPFPGIEQDPLLLHRYLYAKANPVLFIDPSGMFGLLQLLGGVAIIGVLLGFLLVTVFGSRREKSELFWKCVGRQVTELLSATLGVIAAGSGAGILYAGFGPQSIDFNLLTKSATTGGQALLAVQLLIDFGERGIITVTFNRAAMARLGLGTIGKAAFAGEAVSLAAANPIHVTIAFLVGFTSGVLLGAMLNCR